MAFELPFAVAAVAVEHPAAFVLQLSVVAAVARVAALPFAVLVVAAGGEADPALAVVAAGFAAARYSPAPLVGGRWLPAGFQAGWHWDYLQSDYLQSHSADGSARRSQRWNSAGWHSVDSHLADWDSAGSDLADWHLRRAARRPVDSADLAAQGVRCFDFATGDRAAPDGLQSYPSEEVPPLSQELRLLRWRSPAVVDWREPVSSPQDGHRSPALLLLAELRELQEAAARFLLQRCDSQVSPVDEPWREQRRQ